VARTPAGGQIRPVIEGRSETRQPPLFKVLMHNDDYTTMEFVVEVLQSVFHKPPTEANRIMLHIHFKGLGMCGVFPFEVAETKVARVHAIARAQGYPLRCTLDSI
jgi:ATP-dependent Clp protease adaptor protein ClpS